MTMDRLASILKEKGYYLRVKKTVTRFGERRYFYARKWMHEDIYIGPETRVENMTDEDVVEMLPKASGL